jgi:hypothetical protein
VDWHEITWLNFSERSKMSVFTDMKWINSMKMFKENLLILGG